MLGLGCIPTTNGAIVVARNHTCLGVLLIHHNVNDFGWPDSYT
jgi:hypothetical protein